MPAVRQNERLFAKLSLGHGTLPLGLHRWILRSNPHRGIFVLGQAQTKDFSYLWGRW